ncbi:glycogen debranching N-terminal domain-containing protein [Dokdonella sp.]|uniref:amylo-alpha-1,6-glucosidase n=1 Tax=Dokdonella sp. TaxID=2291710 RepID=UPI001B202671|nr:glycogen debranching N-terminal domain-containing protein [Dokdonella sp.]MBO9662869.1 amylo-alpha-1,6-glucosidase [Dokdonella sp.]
MASSPVLSAPHPGTQPGDPYRVASDSVYADESAYVLNHADTFAVIDRWGDVRAGGGGSQGVYHRDTRYLSLLQARLNGERPVLLTSTVTDDNLTMIVETCNAEAPDLPKSALHLRKRIAIHAGLCDAVFEVHNYGLEAHEVELAVRADADFRDIFEVRGMHRPAPAPARTAELRERGIAFDYEGLDGVSRRTRLEFSLAPESVDADGYARFRWTLPPGGTARLVVAAVFVQWNAPPVEDAVPAHATAVRAGHWRERLPTIETNYGPLNLWLARSAADLVSLITDTPHGPYPYAGVPWYNTAFGRDGLITALELLWPLPELAAGVLRFLAATQAQVSDAARDAEPGKIVHETRLGEMARLGEVPFGRYYGAVDGTPLFVVLAGEYLRRTGDLALVRELWPAIEAALGWIREHGDLDGDGFVEYANRSGDGLANQGWKDSVDSVSHADGRLATAPIALCEVQGYVYAAWNDAAYMLHRLGDAAGARRLRETARTLKQRFNQVYWDAARATYALALDGDKRPCLVRASNAGQCLWTRIAHRAKAERLARSLFEPSMFSGWGVRTLGAGEARYNPLSYHNGSVWPHDNALIALGLARYGFSDAAARVFAALLEAATALPLHRMPELYCGFERTPCSAPVPYPVACSPQAWAVGTVYLLLGALLGLHIDAPRRTLAFRSPRLPPEVDWLRIERWHLCDGPCELEFRRHGADIALNVTRKPAGWTVLTIK